MMTGVISVQKLENVYQDAMYLSLAVNPSGEVHKKYKIQYSNLP